MQQCITLDIPVLFAKDTGSFLKPTNVNTLHVKRYELVIKADLHVTGLTEFKMPRLRRAA